MFISIHSICRNILSSSDSLLLQSTAENELTHSRYYVMYKIRPISNNSVFIYMVLKWKPNRPQVPCPKISF